MAFSVSPTNLWYYQGRCQSNLDFAPGRESNLRFPSVGGKSIKCPPVRQLVLKKHKTVPCLSMTQRRECSFPERDLHFQQWHLQSLIIYFEKIPRAGD